jgi:hypothetical protein
MIKLMEEWLKRKETNKKISSSLKSYHATKRAEAGYHRVRSYLNGKYEGTYLLPNL